MTIRVLFGDMAAMAESALRGSLAGCDDIELVARAPAAASYGGVDVLVLHQTQMSECPRILKRLMQAAPIGVVAIDESGTAGDLYRLDHQDCRFVAGGREALADAIRRVAGAA